MQRLRLAALFLCCLSTAGALGHGDAMAAEGKVTLPLDDWTSMLDKLRAAHEPPLPDVAVTPIGRRIEGTFNRGLFSGELVARFEVLRDDQPWRVPVLDSAASVSEVTLDGQRTSLLREGDLYTVGVAKRGTHEVRLSFFVGEEQDRFARRIRFRLPQAGSTSLSVSIPEVDIEAELDGGAIAQTAQAGGNTHLTAYLDANGKVELSWHRRLTHASDTAVRTEAEVNTVFTVGEALVRGLSAFDVKVLEGETDRIDVTLPRGFEVMQVAGDAVLQWTTEDGPEGSTRLGVLLRYLADDAVHFVVHFQFPVDASDNTVSIQSPLPAGDGPKRGALGLVAPSGLSLTPTPKAGVKEIPLRDLPESLTELTSAPLRVGYRFSEAPSLEVAIVRQQDLELTSTVIDDLQAASVVLEDGNEITKLKLRVRNNTRQYLAVRLPNDAVLTHALVDGQPIRPAVQQGGGTETLEVPLRQSSRIGEGHERYYVVQAGDTLSGIANFYYSDPSAWQRLLDANDDLEGALDLWPGQRLRVPAASGTVEESSFVVELAYKRHGKPLGWAGSRKVILPAFDVDAVKATWHLYLPRATEPLSFSSNLAQYSAIRYDPFRRATQFFERALWVRGAWAGGGRYQSILSQRKSIWEAESKKIGAADVVLSSFPLVGERYRFRRLLLGREQAQLTAVYVDKDLQPPIRWLAFIVALACTLWLLARPNRRRWLIAGAALLLWLVVAHYVLGVHRRLLWGITVGVALAWLRLVAGVLWAEVRSKYTTWLEGAKLVRFATLVRLMATTLVLWIILMFPLLLSTMLLVTLALLYRRARAHSSATDSVRGGAA